jgi:hypothetical protein
LDILQRVKAFVVEMELQSSVIFSHPGASEPCGNRKTIILSEKNV